MATQPVPLITVRGSTGISMQYGPPTYDLATSCPRDLSKHCKVMAFSPNGQYFAWSNSVVVRVVSTKDWKEVCQLERPKIMYMKFSPKGSFLMTWEPFMTTPANPQGTHNMAVYKTATGTELKSYVFKKHSGWELQWSDDEKLCARNSGNDIFFYENGDLETVVTKLGFKAESYTKQGPSFGRLFQYPKFGQTDAVANKSFFQAERLDSFWNAKGTGVLLMTNVDVDSTGASYYGKQGLHYLTTKGDTSIVTLGKKVYIKFILDCCVLLLLAGFGNLRGAVEVWEAPARKQVTTLNAPDSTWLGWCPDGEHFVTATTAPRLRQGNGFKVWHYSGALLFERPWNKEEELLEVQWQTFPASTFKAKPVVYKKIEGIAPSQPEASKEIYRPPLARGKESNFNLHVNETAKYIRPAASSKPGQKKKKKKPKAKEGDGEEEHETGGAPSNAVAKPASTGGSTAWLPPGITEADITTDDVEVGKKIKNIKRKLVDIQKLKEQAASGKQLELNQKEKISKEKEIIAELRSLVL
ncbi:hypothetical protein B566_EDAN014226 [Ephemera danica]|nr:hypothetical protein B566_EDAN014226 [Ephemera danica]